MLVMELFLEIIGLLSESWIWSKIDPSLKE